jgi:hypothetical protein
MGMIEGSSCNNTVVKHLQYRLSGAHKGGKWPKLYVVPTVDDGWRNRCRCDVVKEHKAVLAKNSKVLGLKFINCHRTQYFLFKYSRVLYYIQIQVKKST